MRMKKKWHSILAMAIAALVLTATAVPVMAQSEGAPATDSKPVVRALGIKAPRIAPVGEEFTMGVFQRGYNKPVEGAGVWALSRDDAEALKEDIAPLREAGELSAQDTDFESMVSIYGTFLGRTNEEGKLSATIDEAGGYLLVAVKRGFIPGYAPLSVRETPDALGIKVPRIAPVGEEFTMGVFQRGIFEPVEGAGVWALSRDDAKALKEDIAPLREAGDLSAAQDTDFESMVSIYGTFLGRTNGEGKLSTTIDETGGYLLVAVKQGFIPGYAPLSVREIPDALGIRAPKVAPVGEEFTMGVFQRGYNKPVEGAGVWALSRDDAEALKEDTAPLREAGDLSAAQDTDFESMVSIYGTFLGRTNGEGKLSATIDEAGGYLLVAVKRGFIPGYSLIRIAAPEQSISSTNFYEPGR